MENKINGAMFPNQTDMERGGSNKSVLSTYNTELNYNNWTEETLQHAEDFPLQISNGNNL